MSEKEVRPGLTDIVKAVISGYTTGFERAYYIETPGVERVSLKPLYTIGVGRVYGLRVIGSSKALKNILGHLVDHDEASLLESYIFLSEEQPIGLFFINTSREDRLWDLINDLSNFEEIDLIEIIKPKKGSEAILFNPWMYPPKINAKTYSLIPVSTLSKISNLVSREGLSSIARDLVREYRELLGDIGLSLETLLKILEVTGLCLFARYRKVDDKAIVEITPIRGMECGFYESIVEEFIGRKVSSSMSNGKCFIVYSVEESDSKEASTLQE